MIGLKTRIKEMKKLGMTEVKVDIETLEGLLEQRPERVSVDAVVSVHNPELVRAIVRRIKQIRNSREPKYELPADSFIEDCAKDIIKIIKNAH